MELWPRGLDPTRAVYMGVRGAGGWLCSDPATACCRDVSSVEVLMNYHQGLKTELEARVPELTACQELGRSLLLNKSAMADEVGRGAGGSPPLSVSTGVGATLTPLPPTHHSQIQAQLDKLGTKKEEVSDKWDRHWEWLQQSKWGPGRTWLQGTGTFSTVFRKAQRVTQACFAHHSQLPSSKHEGLAGWTRGLSCH